MTKAMLTLPVMIMMIKTSRNTTCDDKNRGVFVPSRGRCSAVFFITIIGAYARPGLPRLRPSLCLGTKIMLCLRMF